MASGPITSWQIDGETMETVTDFIFLSSKITTDGDCSHEIKRRLLLGRKVMTNLDSILKDRNITLLTKVCLVKATVFLVVKFQFSSVQSLSRVWLFATPWTSARQASLSITNSWSSLRLMSIELVMPSNHLILCHPLLLLPYLSQDQGLFQWNSSSHEVAKVLEFQLQHQYFQWIFSWIWLDLLAVQGTLKSLLQYHSPKASILLNSVFFTVQLSHPYMTTGKTIALTKWTFVLYFCIVCCNFSFFISNFVDLVFSLLLLMSLA